MAKTNILTRGKKARAEQLALGGRLEEAEALYAAVCNVDPLDVEALVKVGILCSRLGRYADAEARVRRAVLLAPRLQFAKEALATVLQYRNKTDEAAEVLRSVVAESPRSSESLVTLGRLLERQGRVEEAFVRYHGALDLQPDTSYVRAKRAELLEREGRVDEARRAVDRGLADEPTHPELSLVAARLERRAGHDEAAVARLEALLRQPVADDVAADARILLGQLHDRLGHVERVMPLLTRGRRHVARVSDPGGREIERFLARVDAFRGWSASIAPGSVAPGPPAGDAPIFVIGFLRSGTTLLEQVLDSHPALQALNEKPMGPVVEQAFIDMTGGGSDALATLTDTQVETLRARYWHEAGRHCTRRPGTVLVDKEPLNLIRTPLLWRLFPQARFILTLRHPCDVTLACLMQNFGHYNVMSGFADLDSLAALYDRVMSAWESHVQHLPLHWQAIRYEDLVTAFEPEIRRLLSFLRLPWDDAVLGHTEHARTRGIINTPSYHQVTVPIYQHAKYRWKRYARDFGPSVDILAPYIERFGYAEPRP